MSTSIKEELRKIDTLPRHHYRRESKNTTIKQKFVVRNREKRE